MNPASLRILLIEDDPADVILLRNALAPDTLAHYHVTVAESLREGLEAIAQKAFDAILLDQGLPDAQGLEGLQRLQDATADIPIVVLANLMDEAAAHRAVQAGAQDYVVKNAVGWEIIRQMVRHAIERHRLVRSSKWRFPIAFHRSPACQIITTLKEGRCIDVNAAFCRLMGYTRKEMIGRTTQEIGMWADLAERRAAFAGFRQAGSIQDREVVFRTRSGALLNILASVEPIEIDGEPCVISTALDITERKQTAEALQQSEQRHRLISGLISDYVYSGLAFADGRTCTEWVSGAFEQITGYTMDEINAMPRGFVSLILAEDAEKIAGQTANLLDLPSTTLEYRIRRKDGAIRWIRDSMQQVPGGEPEGTVRRVGAVQDITERRAAEEATRNRERQMLALVSSLDDIVFEVDERGIYRNVWTADDANLFRPRAEIIGKRFDEIFGEKASKPYFEYLARTLESDSAQTLEYSLEFAGTQRWYAARFNPIHDEEETRRSVSILVRDISEQKQAEVQLRESHRRSQAMLDAIPDMMFRLDRQGFFLDYKVEQQNLYSQDQPSLIGLRNRDIVPAEFADLIEQKIDETLSTGTLQTFEFQLSIPNIGDQDYEARMSPSGHNEVIAIVRNITERKEAEEALRESERRFSTVFFTNPVSQSVLSQATGQVMAVNDATCDLYGHSREELIGVAPGELDLWANPAEQLAVVDELQRTGRLLPTEVTIRTKSGRLRTIFFAAEPITWQGTPCLVTSSIDITARKEAEVLISAQRDLALSIGTFKTVEEGLRTILETVLKLTGMDSGGIYLFAPDCQRLDLVYHHGLGAAFIGAMSSFTMDSRNVQMILAGEPHYFASGDPVLENPLHQIEKLRSLAVVPVLHQERVIGCFNLASHTQEEVSPFSRQVLETLVVEIGNLVQHVQAQAELHASEEKYRSLADASDAIIVMLDVDGRIQYMNEKAAEVSDIQIADALGKTLHELLPKEIADLSVERVQEVIATGRGMVVESPIADGSYLRTSIQPIHDENGVAIMALMSATDITGLKTIQQQLLDLNRSLEERVRERTAEVQDLYDNAPTGYHSLDAEGRFVQINQTELNWLGYTRDELIGRPLSDISTPESIEVFRQTFPKLIASGSARDIEFEFVRKDGSLLPGLVNATVVYGDDGAFLRSRSTVFDNSERKAAEQALRESEEQNRLLFENTPDAVVLFDRQGRLVRVNRAFELLSGCAAEECIGNTMHSLGLLSEHEVTSLASGVMESLHSQDRFAAAEFRITSANGDEHDVGARVFGVTFQGRHHYLTSMRDVTVEKEAAETLRLANIEMERALHMKDEFLANMSHELRTPLQGILGMSELLREQIRGPLNERQQKAVRDIEESGRHLLTLINDLLDISKIEAGKLELDFQAVSVDEICRASMLFVREVATKKQVQVEYANTLPGVQLSADATRLKQMLVNLLSNAVKFTPQGGQVNLNVTIEPGAKLIHFAVKDTGPGIAPSDQTRIFQPFAQLDARLSRQFEGTGLGLLLVKRLAEQHGGTVRLESAGIPGQGSCFIITLPYVPVQQQDPASDAQLGSLVDASAAIPGSSPLLLVVEDNEVIIEVMDEVLKYAGYRVALARTGAEALKMASEIGPDLILMDVQLPLMDGLEVTRRLRKQARFATTPIIAVTASAMTGDHERCLAAGASDYLSKPLRMLDLLKMIESLIKS